MATVAFRVLGPLEAEVDGRQVALGGPKPRLLLATLLLRPNTAVSTDVLVDVLWPGSPPRSAAANVRTYVHGLRRLLDNRIEHRPGGYLLRASPEEIDLCRFEDTRDPDLWRGGFLDDLPPCDEFEPTRARVTELWLAAREERLRAGIDRGEHEPAIAELRGLLSEHPLREELWQLLIHGLTASGRRADAVAAYTEAARVLRAELDTTPGPELLAALTPVCQLPRDLPDFTGRDDLVGELVGLVSDRDSPTVVVLSGPPGVGKSAVAVRVAHLTRAAFPDGQLHLDLAGTAPTPRRPMDVLPELLRAVGVTDLPRTLTERAALLRSALASRRMCLVLDDACSAAQVAPLLPGAGGSSVLVTSRVMLPDLVGTHPVELDVLGEPEATSLLAGIVGAARTNAEPDSAAAILRFCGRLPLAIRVAGTRLAHRRGWTLRTLADRLRDERRRLDELSVGDLAVRASVGLSYASLPEDAARAFRLLGLLGPVRWPGWVVGALLDRDTADDVLDLLVDNHLVELVGPDRYRLHDLLRCFAAELSERDDKAVDRVLSRYLDRAAAAAAGMPYFGVLPVVSDPDGDAVEWFDAERHTGVAMVSLAEAWGFDDHAWRLAATFAPYFDLRGHQDDWRRTHVRALAAARRCGDRRGEAIILRNLGQVALYRDEYPGARAAFTTAHELFAELRDDRGAAVALAGLGSVLRILGEHDRALDRCHAALGLFARVGDRHGEAVVRLAAGSVWLALGCLAPAGRWFTDAYELCAAIGDRHREAHALKRIATLHQRRGDLRAARDHLGRALTIFHELDDEHCVGYTNQSLGELCLRSGELTAAGDLLTTALARHHRNGDRRSEADVAELLASLHETRGDGVEARRHAARAQVIRALIGTGRTDGSPENAPRTGPVITASSP
ncbi:AfsR/SARP family transcriptional regulator [Actinophytocola oryzae]|uniref:DNA-binding SARP family transcriptional activator n=1 Tax=Actinophytocola oryzae TaxID=502181 RepID=A0A4R7VZS0_9PSEU|nr:BTAD domain-containing putative transcriptional regulator [Actinophytocola oryzae]TDV55168.1 DNA-binding SARP family transcriptional activator [Actinophytocola oryzae]